MFVTMAENCDISRQKQRNRMVIRKLLKCMAAQTVVAVNTKRNVFINIILKKMLTRIKS